MSLKPQIPNAGSVGVIRANARRGGATDRAGLECLARAPGKDHHRALGIVLLSGPRGVLFPMSEVPLHRALLQG